MRLLGSALLTVLGALGAMVAGPGVANACACGAAIADELTPVRETALVELDGPAEHVTVNIGADTTSDSVAFLMPVPSRAGFAIADGALFTELDEVSRPRVEYREVEIDGDGAGGAAPGGEVTVVDHVEVGPYELAQLSGTDDRAVSDWLTAKDFTLPPDLAGHLAPYLADGWLVVAVHLRPEVAGETFDDALPPMRISFATDEPVYPMRLSAAADHGQPLRLYVLADHRMDVTDPTPGDGAPEVNFAGWLTPGDLDGQPELAKLVPERRFLTRYDAWVDPAEVTDDIRLTRAPEDEAYRAVVIQTRYVRGLSTVEVTLVVLGGVVLAGLAAGAVILVRRRRRTRAG
jgi:hypothetical protein